jgi:small subunit ribosomal protein S7
MAKKKKKKIKHPPVLPDPLYNNLLVAKFINHVMRRGKKTLAQKIVYKAFGRIEKEVKKQALEVFEKALENVGPLQEVRSMRIGGATYQVPIPVKQERRRTLAMRWIIEAARNKKGKPMEEKLAQELLMAAKGEGEAVRKKINVHKMAEANRAFAHFAR